MTLDERSAEGDYTGLPGWYLKDLLAPRILQTAAQHHVTTGEAATILCAGDRTAASHLNYLINDKIQLVGLRICERLLDLVGLQLTDADEQMWVPLHGVRPAVRMAGDILYAAGRPLTEEALLEVARSLIARRTELLQRRP